MPGSSRHDGFPPASTSPAVPTAECAEPWTPPQGRGDGAKWERYRNSVPAPTLLTERLRLDAHRADDLETFAAWWQRPEVYAGIGQPRDREEVWLRLLRSIGQWTLFGYGAWVVRTRDTGAAIGEVGLMEVRRAIEPPLDAPEIGWLLAPEAQGRGLAAEALAAVLRWSDGGRIARTTCIIDPDNARSIRLATRAGYHALGERRYRDRSVIVFERQAVA